MAFVDKKTLDGRRAKRSRRYETQDDFVWVDWYPVVAGTIDTVVPAFGAARPGDTVPWGYTCNQVDTETDKNDQSYLVVTWKKPKRLDTSTTFSEVKRVWGTGVSGRNYGTRVFLMPSGATLALTESTAASYIYPYVTWPGESGYYARTATDVVVEHNWRIGLARIIVQYTILGEQDWLESHIGKGLLYSLVEGEPITLNYGYATDSASEPSVAEPIVAEGVSTATARVVYRWSLFKGSNTELHGTTQLMVRVVLQTPRTDLYARLVGRHNASACIHIANAQVHHLKFLGAKTTPLFNSGGLHLCDFYLSFNPDEWHKSCQAIKEVFEVIAIQPNKNDSGKIPVGSLANSGRWSPELTDAVATVEDRIVSRSDAGLGYTIAHIDAYMNWS
ncbi:MAG: hypothetical protein IMZ62_16600 [Chloroflexi bacterium]|nr:hypothetical protein [Chloroflexota bacterium]